MDLIDIQLLYETKPTSTSAASAYKILYVHADRWTYRHEDTQTNRQTNKSLNYTQLCQVCFHSSVSVLRLLIIDFERMQATAPCVDNFLQLPTPYSHVTNVLIDRFSMFTLDVPINKRRTSLRDTVKQK